MNMDIGRLFNICKEIELKCAELYFYLAEGFRDDPQLSSLLEKTGNEELSHAKQFDLALSFDVSSFSGAVIDPWMANNSLKIITSVLEGAKRHRPAKLDALRSLIKLEKQFSAFHVDCMAIFNDEKIKNTFERMMAADKGHEEMLEDAYSIMLAKTRSQQGNIG